MKRVLTICALVAMLIIGSAGAATVALTGNPAADGWNHGGHSLEKGVYVRGSENVGFDLYTTYFNVTDSSVFNISGHDDSAYSAYYGTTPWTKANARTWEIGDAVIGIGGVFQYITAEDAGWDAFTGKTVNSTIDNEYRFRLQAKIGTADATWEASTLAPTQTDGNGSSSNGGLGSLFVRTSGWHASTTWENFAGMMLGLQDTGHITRDGTGVEVDAARVIWTWDDNANRPATWQLLVNLTLVDADAAEGFTGLLPTAGDKIIGSVQIENAGYTDALVPEPATMSLLGLAGVALIRRKRK